MKLSPKEGRTVRRWLLALLVSAFTCAFTIADDQNKADDKKKTDDKSKTADKSGDKVDDKKKTDDKSKSADKPGDKASDKADKTTDKPGDKAADKSKAAPDSPIVKKTREKLEAKITVEFTDDQIKDVVEELGKMLEVSIRLHDPSIPRQKRINYKAMDKPGKDVLDEMLKTDGLGYVIHRKENANDRYEGYVDIVVGDQRGDPTPPKKDKDAKTAKPDPKAKGDKSDAAKTTKTETSDEEKERLAKSRLKLAKQFVEDGQKEDAIDFLESLLKKYPNTEAATEAKKLLEKLKK
jgi:hypothetical protein